MTEQELRPCPFCGCDTLEIFTDYYSRRTVNCPYCGLWRLLDTWNNRPIEDKLNNTIDVLTKKYANVQFVNKKLQEKIKRQSERITQLEALYREEIKTKKQNALREHAEKAEAKALKLEQEGAYREMELFSLLNLLDVDKECQTGSLDMWQTCFKLASKTTKELKSNRKMIEQMIERVDNVKNTLSNYFHLFHAPNVGSFLDDWNALVAEWKERE